MPNDIKANKLPMHYYYRRESDKSSVRYMYRFLHSALVWETMKRFCV